MKKWFVVILVLLGVLVCFIPLERSITFTETRVEKPTLYFSPLKKEPNFQIIFTHSIHLTDVKESYQVLPSNEFQLLAMEYSDVAIGMPSYAEEGQTLHYENGVYTLRYDNAKLKDFVLHIGDVDYKLELHHKGKILPLKEHLIRGKSYVVKVEKMSLYDKMKGVELDD
ncbi:DUF1850 domain-containing protein [Lysinibacillus sp. 2017]|uniref:DUF1850 domain-containing protein n=1 Tax=unclassified Lysinibacillus TaxID=2636778 RepID=UPI000D5268E8|nr:MULTISPECIES: DUF1850 domain-containing protein [unclassified Lysinibacillus]AWE06109.1 DUF1850 domain-containing protein [Lysinibacillus sp. 2017]TGN30757.1 DUF1850 domain-containing protein [Lysinibacillus sp. S2017]